MSGERLNKHERHLLSLVEAARSRYHNHDNFRSWLRGFTRPGTFRAVLADRLRKFLE